MPIVNRTILAEMLGVHQANLYRRIRNHPDLAPPAILGSKPLRWDTDSPEFQAWWNKNPSGPAGRKRYVCAGEIARLLKITPRALTERLKRGSFVPPDMDALGERLWLLTTLNPFLDRLQRRAHGWPEPSLEPGEQTVLPGENERCGYVRYRRHCQRQAVMLVREDGTPKPRCGVCGRGKEKTYRIVEAPLEAPPSVVGQFD